LSLRRSDILDGQMGLADLTELIDELEMGSGELLLPTLWDGRRCGMDGQLGAMLRTGFG
jgi:hypothetical protein